MKWPLWLSTQLLTLAGIGVLAFLLMGQCNRVRDLKAAAAAVIAAQAKDAEAADLKVKGVETAAATSQAALQATIDGYRARGDALADALAVALKASPGAKPVASATGSTGPVHVDAGAAPSSAPVPAAGTVAPPSSTVPASVCLLRPGDEGEIRVSGAALKTEAGNTIVVAQGEAWRLNPDARLFGGELHLSASYLKPPDPARAPGWGGGLEITGGRHGWAWGPVVASPPLSIWRLQVDPSVGLTLGSAGEWNATAQALVRWR
jgi:hypothetical protein